MSEEALQIAEERRSEKQGRKGKVHPTKRRVPENSKERQEGLLQWTTKRNRGGKMRKGKTRDLIKKIRIIKGTVHPKMGNRKDRNHKDLIEAKEIKKR